MTPLATLLDLTQDELIAHLAAWNQPRYRALQMWDWLYKKLATDPAEMTNLPKGLRERLATESAINPLAPVYEQRSTDRETVKWLFRLPDGLTIETVLMRYDERNTVCISTQAGCAMGCVFCATGLAGLARNLTAGEIVAQVLAAARWLAITDGRRTTDDERRRTKTRTSASSFQLPASNPQSSVPNPQSLVPNPQSPISTHLTNIVVMGMGEPLANYDRTWQALRTLTAPDGFGLGARHITVSTVGLVPGIRRMAAEPLQINLAVSLHAPNDDLRSRLVPINHRYPIADLMAAVRDYVTQTHRRVTFEYALMNGINDTPAIARELAALLRGLLCHVNLIPLNPVAESPFQPTSPEHAAGFQLILEKSGIPATVRLRRGIEIDAGCGQLRRRLKVEG